MRTSLDRKRKTKDPCPNCLLHRDLCLCEFIPKLDLKTKVTLVVHYKELKRTTNTGQLALKALVNSEMRIRGEERERLDLSDLLNDHFQTYLLYPCADAVELNRNLIEQSTKPVQLIVPDGNWRQASKVHYRHSELAPITRVILRGRAPQEFTLRKETMEEGMATLEAIAEALGVIEGDQVKSELLKLYQLKLNRTLQGRGVFK